MELFETAITQLHNLSLEFKDKLLDIMIEKLMKYRTGIMTTEVDMIPMLTDDQHIIPQRI